MQLKVGPFERYADSSAFFAEWSARGARLDWGLELGRRWPVTVWVARPRPALAVAEAPLALQDVRRLFERPGQTMADLQRVHVLLGGK
jgi:hypothetical protein